MNIFQLFSVASPLVTLLGGAALYAIGHAKGSKAAEQAAPKIAEIEGKVSNTLALVSALQATATSHDQQFSTVNNLIGQAQGTAATAVSVAASKSLPPELSSMVSEMVTGALDGARQKLENMTSQALQYVSSTPVDVNVSRRLTVGELAQPAPAPVPPAPSAVPPTPAEAPKQP